MANKRFLKYWRYRERRVNKMMRAAWLRLQAELMYTAELATWGLPHDWKPEHRAENIHEILMYLYKHY